MHGHVEIARSRDRARQEIRKIRKIRGSREGMCALGFCDRRHPQSHDRARTRDLDDQNTVFDFVKTAIPSDNQRKRGSAYFAATAAPSTNTGRTIHIHFDINKPVRFAMTTVVAKWQTSIQMNGSTRGSSYRSLPRYERSRTGEVMELVFGSMTCL